MSAKLSKKEEVKCSGWEGRAKISSAFELKSPRYLESQALKSDFALNKTISVEEENAD